MKPITHYIKEEHDCKEYCEVCPFNGYGGCGTSTPSEFNYFIKTHIGEKVEKYFTIRGSLTGGGRRAIIAMKKNNQKIIGIGNQGIEEYEI